MTVYTMPIKKHQENQKKDSWNKFENFLNKHETILTAISVIMLLITGFFLSAAFGNPVTN